LSPVCAGEREKKEKELSHVITAGVKGGQTMFIPEKEEGREGKKKEGGDSAYVISSRAWVWQSEGTLVLPHCAGGEKGRGCSMEKIVSRGKGGDPACCTVWIFARRRRERRLPLTWATGKEEKRGS